jgi:drug/metabolite transporter (DMT)-like permease
LTAARVTALTTAALVAFAANSLLTRGALAALRIDPASFLAVRLASGAAVLWLLARTHHTRVSAADPANHWSAALALTGYAVAFTFAYVRIGAGVGALTLFGAVQTTMIAAGVQSGERPSAFDIAGLAIALAGLLTLTVPGASRPPLAGVALMAIAGTCWGIYSLKGRRSIDPLIGTAHNFARATPIGLAVLVWQWPHVVITPTGLLLAATSGGITSGLGYAVWYSVLPQLTAWREALVQLLTPVLTTVAAVVMLGETMSWRFALAGGLIVSGVLLSLAAPKRIPR